MGNRMVVVETLRLMVNMLVFAHCKILPDFNIHINYSEVCVAIKLIL